MGKIFPKPVLAFFAILLFSAETVYADHTNDYYDNRDSNHANLSLTSHSGVTYMSSGYGAQMSYVADRVVIGNSSTAYTTGDYWGSQVRVNYMRNSYGAGQVYQQYIHNNAYWYPEHVDHDGTDYFFGMTPAVNNSQGSSGSELDEMDKWFYALDAFNIDTKTWLVEHGLLMPTIQMIARRTRVASDEEYLTGKAHANAYDNFSNRVQMQEMAANMQKSNVPPMAKISIIDDLYAGSNILDFFETSGTERQYSTPVSISRIFRGREYTKTIRVSAKESTDSNNLPLTYRWSIIRGNSSNVRIIPMNADNSEVQIEIDYHPVTVVENSTRNSNLVSIGAFVHNGAYYSAPAFVTSYTLNNESREYDPESKRLLRITYNSNYVDPIISTNKSWDSDAFDYDSSGMLLGWTRTKGTEVYSFTKEGYLVTEKDANEKPIMAAKVYYSKDSTTKKLVWIINGSPFPYENYSDLISPASPSGLAIF